MAVLQGWADVKPFLPKRHGSRVADRDTLRGGACGLVGQRVEIRASKIWANGLEFGLLQAAPARWRCAARLPDTARTWRYLLPELAAAGFRAVAPFMRGYAPTAVPDDGRYSVGTLADDAIALHEVLGGDGHAVLIGHDWGAEAAYTAAVAAPDRWRRVVTLAVPPAAQQDQPNP